MIELSPLPYSYDALEPVLSTRTLQIHHDRHHAKYVEVVNHLTHELDWPEAALETIMAKAEGESRTKLSQNAVQAWNHGFFWNSMARRPEAASGALANAIARTGGGASGLKTAFVAAGLGHFGSGWIWLVLDDGMIAIRQSHDGDPRRAGDGLPLLVCDVWEHAYYLDHQNDRAAFLEGWWDRLANWSFAASQMAAAASGGNGWTYADGSHFLSDVA